MVEINLDNEWVDLAIQGVATVIGIAAGCLVGGMCSSSISNQSGISKYIYKAGKFGLETVVTYKVASTMNDDIHECVELYNDTARKINAGEKIISEEE